MAYNLYNQFTTASTATNAFATTDLSQYYYQQQYNQMLQQAMYSYQPLQVAIPGPAPEPEPKRKVDCDEFVWLKKRVKEIEWRA